MISVFLMTQKRLGEIGIRSVSLPRLTIGIIIIIPYRLLYDMQTSCIINLVKYLTKQGNNKILFISYSLQSVDLKANVIYYDSQRYTVLYINTFANTNFSCFSVWWMTWMRRIKSKPAWQPGYKFRNLP